MKTSLSNRRSFLQFLAMVAAGGQALWHTRDLQAAVETAKDAAASVLEAAAETGWYSLAMIAVLP